VQSWIFAYNQDKLKKKGFDLLAIKGKMKGPLLASAITYFSILCYRMPDNTYAEGLAR
jgi:hypothetical protein